MRNILEKVKRQDEKQVKSEAQKIYLATNMGKAKRAFERFRFHWRRRYPAMVQRLERDLSDLLHFFSFPCDLCVSVS
jgi:transposase-like protein